MKVGATVILARNAGTTTTYDELNKFFTIDGMPIAASIEIWYMAIRKKMYMQIKKGVKSCEHLVRIWHS